jgi:hypothetical protein
LAVSDQPESVTEWLNLADVLKFTKRMQEATTAMTHVVYHLKQWKYSGRLAGLQLWTASWGNYTKHREAAAQGLLAQHAQWEATLKHEGKSGVLLRLSRSEREAVLSTTSATDLYDIPPRLMPWSSLGPVLRVLATSPPELPTWKPKCGFDPNCTPHLLKKRALRVGVLSPDWDAHPVFELSVGMLEQLAVRPDIELVVISASSVTSSLADGLVRQADAVVNLNLGSVVTARQTLRDMKLDIILDLAGHTVGGGFGLLSGRIAPLQISYLGYPATSAAPWIDFVLADRYVLPPETVQAGSHSEQIAYMTGPYIPSSHAELYRAVGMLTDAERAIWRGQIIAALPAESCSPHEYVLLGVLSGQHKIDPPTMQIWLEILRSDPCTCLILCSTGVHGEVESHVKLRVWVQAQGVDPQRLQWLPRMEVGVHLAVKSGLDLVLDTPLKSGHSTHVDAQWAGLPVVSLQGRHMHQRAPGSLCRHQSQACAFITHSQREYKQTVIDLIRPGPNGTRTSLLAAQAAARESVRQALDGVAENAVWDTYDQAVRLSNILHASYAICEDTLLQGGVSSGTLSQPNIARRQSFQAWGGGWSACRLAGHVFSGSHALWRSILKEEQRKG